MLDVKLNDLVEFVVTDEATLFESHVVRADLLIDDALTVSLTILSCQLHLHGHSFAYLGSEKVSCLSQQSHLDRLFDSFYLKLLQVDSRFR